MRRADVAEAGWKTRDSAAYDDFGKDVVHLGFLKNED